MEEFKTEIEINAKPERVWDILIDFNKYPVWNPFIRQVTGKAEIGSQLAIFLESHEGKIIKFMPRVTISKTNKELRWIWKLIVPRLFEGEHRFAIKALDKGGVIFTQKELLNGVLVPLLGNMLFTKTKAGFEEMNKALKERAEAS
jgi:hypothetical protein